MNQFKHASYNPRPLEQINPCGNVWKFIKHNLSFYKTVPYQITPYGNPA